MNIEPQEYYDLTTIQEYAILTVLLIATDTRWEYDGEKFEVVRTHRCESPNWTWTIQEAVKKSILELIPDCKVETGDFDAELMEGGRIDYEHVTIYKA